MSDFTSSEKVFIPTPEKALDFRELQMKIDAIMDGMDTEDLVKGASVLIVRYLNRYCFFLRVESKQPCHVATFQEGKLFYKAYGKKAFMDLFLPYKLETEITEEYQDRKGNVKTRKKKISNSVGKIWMAHEERRMVECIFFDPEKPAGDWNANNLDVLGRQTEAKNYLNNWWGWEWSKYDGSPDGIVDEVMTNGPVYLDTGEPIPKREVRKSIEHGFERIVYHVEEVMFRGCEKLYTYFWNWLAHVLQRPGRKTEVVIVLTGKMGAGKSIFLSYLCRGLERHTMYFAQSDDIGARFNGSLNQDKILFGADEVDLKSKKNMDWFKNQVTAKDARIESKFVDTRQVKNYANYILTSNDDNCLCNETGHNMRRFFLVKVDDSKVDDEPYWKELVMSFENMEMASMKLLFCWLMRRDITDFNPRDKPKTEELLNQQQSQMSKFEEWWVGCLREEQHIPPYGKGSTTSAHVNWVYGQVKLQDLYEVFINKTRATNINMGAFVTELKKNLPHCDADINNPTFTMPGYLECREKNPLGSLNNVNNLVQCTNKRKRTREEIEKESEDQSERKRSRQKTLFDSGFVREE